MPAVPVVPVVPAWPVLPVVPAWPSWLPLVPAAPVPAGGQHSAWHELSAQASRLAPASTAVLSLATIAVQLFWQAESPGAQESAHERSFSQPDEALQAEDSLGHWLSVQDVHAALTLPPLELPHAAAPKASATPKARIDKRSLMRPVPPK